MVYYKAKGGFNDSMGDEEVTQDDGTDEFSIVGAKSLVSATITHKMIQESHVDNQKSTWCETNSDSGEKLDPSCQDHEVDYSEDVNAAFLTIVTQ